ILHARALPRSDPFQTLPTPKDGDLGFYNRDLGSPQVNNNNANGLVSPNARDSTTSVVTLNPGYYSSIDIKGGTVVFQPGIYVLKGGGMTLNGGTITGNGVMFYNTGKDYKTDGTPDSSDGSSAPDTSSKAQSNFGSVSLGGSAVVDLKPISNT